MTHEDRLPLIVVQQHSVLREALSLRLEAESDFDVVASVATVTDAASALAAHPSAVVVLDEPSSPEMCRSVVDELRSMSSTARLVMLVNTRQLALVSVAVNAGVAGVLRAAGSLRRLAGLLVRRLAWLHGALRSPVGRFLGHFRGEGSPCAVFQSR